MVPKITNAGYAVVVQAHGGSGIRFTNFKMGNGALPEDYLALTHLVNPLATVSFSVVTLETDYIYLEGMFSNSSTDTDFNWTEIGIYCTDPDNENNEILYAYGHVNIDDSTAQAIPIPATRNGILEIKLRYRIYVGDLEGVTAILADSSTYASRAALNEHIADDSNPHHVTKEQLGLGNVTNVSVNNAKPTVTEASSLTALANGDTAKTLWGKVAKAVSTLISHVANVSNPHNVTYKQVGAAAAAHEHSGADITSGTVSASRLPTVPVTKGGTGAATAAAARTNLGAAAASHTHATSDITSGTLPVANGGTGASTAAAAANNVLAAGAGAVGGNIVFAAVTGTARRGVIGTVGTSDKWRVIGGATADDSGYLEIATADNGTEPIYLRQYNGDFATVARTLILLDASGNTTLPGNLTLTGTFSKFKYGTLDPTAATCPTGCVYFQYEA